MSKSVSEINNVLWEAIPNAICLWNFNIFIFQLIGWVLFLFVLMSVGGDFRTINILCHLPFLYYAFTFILLPLRIYVRMRRTSYRVTLRGFHKDFKVFNCTKSCILSHEDVVSPFIERECGFYTIHLGVVKARYFDSIDERLGSHGGLVDFAFRCLTKDELESLLKFLSKHAIYWSNEVKDFTSPKIELDFENNGATNGF